MRSDEQRQMGRLGEPSLPCLEVADATGLPCLHTWRAVYWSVTFIFLLWVVLLTALTRLFSP